MGVDVGPEEPTTAVVVSDDEMEMQTVRAEAHDDKLVDPEAMPACFTSVLQEMCCVMTTTMAVAMGALLGGAVTVVSSRIGADLNMTTAELTWLPSSSA